ncbi:endonuclease/exonuclease/phosphatase family protein [candidate division KSB1 bacterium]|nr:endonuclease/exonuclease/phosphatase family protein [candidate division KSB1 bacterium]
MYLLLELLVWNAGIRISLFQNQPVIENVANLLNDTIWLPIAFFLPIYLGVLATKVTKFNNIKVILFLVSLSFLVLGFSNPTRYFRYMIYIIVPFFALGLYYIFTFQKIRTNIIIFSFVLLGFILNYRGQLIPSFELNDKNPKLKLLSYNILVNQYGRKRQETIEMIRQEKPDIVFIQEINLLDRKILNKSLSDIYPYQLWSEKFETYNGGVILSRIPFQLKENHNIHTVYMKGYINLNHAVIKFNDQDVHLFNCHLYNSGTAFLRLFFGRLSPSQFREQSRIEFNRHNTEAAKIAEHVLPLNAPIILAGDFNDTPNSAAYRLFSYKLQNAFSKGGWGLGTTFGYQSLRRSLPDKLKFLVFDFLRIDHIFCSKSFKVHSAKVLPFESSDHRPQIVEVELKSLQE